MDRIKALTKITALRIRFKIDDIERTYNKQFQYYLWQQSHEQDIPQWENESLEYDENGFITNVQFSGKTKAGFEILEQDFLDIELRRMNLINPDLLDLDNRKYLEFLKSYFENKQPQPPIKAITKPKRYFTKHHVVSFILDCYANNKPLPEGKEWETAGMNRIKYNGAGNTFYQNHNDHTAGRSLSNEMDIINLIGEDWRSIVLELSDDPETLKTYLERQFV